MVYLPEVSINLYNIKSWLQFTLVDHQPLLRGFDYLLLFIKRYSLKCTAVIFVFAEFDFNKNYKLFMLENKVNFTESAAEPCINKLVSLFLDIICCIQFSIIPGGIFDILRRVFDNYRSPPQIFLRNVFLCISQGP